MIVSVLDLWLPIVLAAVAVFVASFLAWVVLPHHKPDIKKLDDEERLLADIRSKNPTPGVYWFPWYTPADLKDPERKKRHEAGPNGMLVLWPGPPSMGANLVKSFILYLVVGICVGYVGGLHHAPGTEFMPVFRFTGTVAMMSYCLAVVPGAIWFGRTLRATTMDIIDGLVYGGVTGLVFAWLWPAAESAMPALPVVGG
ncbi:MAG: hypothetical protein ACYSUF_03585 [Planctomycetota bacterium]|jgi:hypothetical protein